MLIYVLQPPYYAPPFLLGVEEGGGGWASYQIFEKGEGLDRISILRGGCWEKRGDFFQGVLQFFHKK